jgi:hypothetical protein
VLLSASYSRIYLCLTAEKRIRVFRLYVRHANCRDWIQTIFPNTVQSIDAPAWWHWNCFVAKIIPIVRSRLPSMVKNHISFWYFIASKKRYLSEEKMFERNHAVWAQTRSSAACSRRVDAGRRAHIASHQHQNSRSLARASSSSPRRICFCEQFFFFACKVAGTTVRETHGR